MQSDPVIWQIIGKSFCTFKLTVPADKKRFCKNEYNLTGLCNRMSCPLANSSYATVREVEGKCYLFIKTIERAHLPKDLWEKIELNSKYSKALEEITQHLQYWPQKLVMKVKQRLTRIHQYMIRIRQLSHKLAPKLVPLRLNHEKREKSKEYKALVAARLDFAIKKELLDRLQKGTYGEMYNLNYRAFTEAMEEVGRRDREFVEYEGNSEDEDEDEEENEVEEELNGEVEDLEDLDANPHAGLEEIKSEEEPAPQQKRKQPHTPSRQPEPKRTKSGPRVEIEYEEEPTTTTMTNSSLW